MSTIAFGGMELDDITLDSMTWHWAALGIGARQCRHFPALPFSGMPLGGNACHPMPPTSCKSQGLRPTRLHRVLPVPFVLVPTLISITIAYQYPRPTRLHHVLPIPIILLDIIQNILLLPIGTLGPPVSIAAHSPSAHLSILSHSLPLIPVHNATKYPSAHLSTL